MWSAAASGHALYGAIFREDYCLHGLHLQPKPPATAAAILIYRPYLEAVQTGDLQGNDCCDIYEADLPFLGSVWSLYVEHCQAHSLMRITDTHDTQQLFWSSAETCITKLCQKDVLDLNLASSSCVAMELLVNITYKSHWNHYNSSRSQVVICVWAVFFYEPSLQWYASL